MASRTLQKDKKSQAIFGNRYLSLFLSLIKRFYWNY